MTRVNAVEGRGHRIRVGCAGWTIPRASAEAFASEGSHLERYARVLTCAEVNTSFYREHRESTWRRWAESVPEGFRFAVKAPRAITHDAGLRGEAAELERFLEQARWLGEKMGPVLLQTPPKLAFEGEVARRFFGMLRGMHEGPVALEPRHASWFGEDANEVLAQFGIARVAADPARNTEAGVPGGSGAFAYYRLHGAPRMYYSAYSDEALAGYAEAVRKDAEHGEAWCIFDNTASGAAAANAVRLTELLKG